MFGAASTPFVSSTPAFGAVSPAPSLFGASTPAFGQASTPGFGATGTPAFGQASTAAFGVANTPAFGQVSTPAFGATSTPAFGAAGTPAFGAASTPAFGAASTPAFGAASTPGLFGAASTPSLFGATPSAPTNTAPSLFGATVTPAASAPFSFNTAPGVFGATATAQGGLFAASQPAPGGLFGTLTPPGGPASFAAAPAQPDLGAIREVVSIRDAYVPDNDKFRFQSLFLNVVPDPAAKVKPAGVDDLRWREALQRCGGPVNPDNLWPVPAKGFSDLLARRDAQDAAMAEHAQRMATLLDTARALARKQDGVLRNRMEAVKRRHVELSHLLLRLMRRLDAVESRVATAMNNSDSAAAMQTQHKLHRQLQQVQEQVLQAGAGGLQRHVASLVAAAHARGSVPTGAYTLQALGMHSVQGSVQESGLAEAFNVLKQHTVALQRLQEVLAKDERDLAIMTASDLDTLLTFRPTAS